MSGRNNKRKDMVRKGRGIDSVALRVHRRSIDQGKMRDVEYSRRRHLPDNNINNLQLPNSVLSPVVEVELNTRKRTAKRPEPSAQPPTARIQEEEQTRAGNRPNNRREMLKKWKEEKELKKKLDNMKKKPAFRVTHASRDILAHNKFVKLPPVLDEKKKSKPAPAAPPQRVTRSKAASSAPSAAANKKVGKVNNTRGTAATRVKPKETERNPAAAATGREAPGRVTRSRAAAQKLTEQKERKPLARTRSNAKAKPEPSAPETCLKTVAKTEPKFVNCERGGSAMDSFAPADFTFSAPHSVSSLFGDYNTAETKPASKRIASTPVDSKKTSQRNFPSLALSDIQPISKDQEGGPGVKPPGLTGEDTSDGLEFHSSEDETTKKRLTRTPNKRKHESASSSSEESTQAKRKTPRRRSKRCARRSTASSADSHTDEDNVFKEEDTATEMTTNADEQTKTVQELKSSVDISAAETETVKSAVELVKEKSVRETVLSPIPEVEQGPDPVFRTPASTVRRSRRHTVHSEPQKPNIYSNKRTPRQNRSSCVLRTLSPEEGVKVLFNSPMIEMKRRSIKGNTPGRVSMLDLDDLDLDGSTTASSVSDKAASVTDADKQEQEKKDSNTNTQEENAETQETQKVQETGETQETANDVPQSTTQEKQEGVDDKTQEVVKETQEVTQGEQEQTQGEQEVKQEAESIPLQTEEVMSHAPDVPNTDQGELSSTSDSLGSKEGEHDVPYFRGLLVTETQRLNDLCSHWENVNKNDKLTEEVQGQIRTTIGKAQLLIAQRFKQFSGLVDNCEFGTGEKATHCSDLQGFWDMVYFQVEDVDAQFQDLTKMQEKGWKQDKPQSPKKVVKKKVSKPVTGKPKSKPAGKSRFAAFRAQMMQQKKQQSQTDIEVNVAGTEEVTAPAAVPVAAQPSVKIPGEESSAAAAEETSPAPAAECRVFDGGFFSVSSPKRTPKQPASEAEPTSGVKAVKPPSRPISGDNTPATSPLLKSVLRRSLRRSQVKAQIPLPTTPERTTQVESASPSGLAPYLLMKLSPLAKAAGSPRSLKRSPRDQLPPQTVDSPVRPVTGNSIFTPETTHISNSASSLRRSTRRSAMKVAFTETPQVEKEHTEENMNESFSKYLAPTTCPATEEKMETEISSPEDVEMAATMKRDLSGAFETSAAEEKKSSRMSSVQKTRRSVHFLAASPPQGDSPQRLPLTPYNRDSLVPRRRMGSNTEADISAKMDSLLFTPPHGKRTPARQECNESVDLIMFSP